MFLSFVRVMGPVVGVCELDFFRVKEACRVQEQGPRLKKTGMTGMKGSSAYGRAWTQERGVKQAVARSGYVHGY